MYCNIIHREHVNKDRWIKDGKHLRILFISAFI